MNRKIRKSLVLIAIIISLIVPAIAYAISSQTDTSSQNTESSFITASESVSPGENIEFTIDLESIDYDSFIFTLKSESTEISSSDIETSEDVEEETTDSDNEFKIIVNKSDLEVSSLIITYTVPSAVSVGTTLTFTATVEKYTSGTVAGSTDAQEETLTVSIEESSDTRKETNNQNMSQNGQNDQSMSSQSMGQSGASISSMTTTTMQGSSISDETNTYNGSDNNYLKSLSISGYDIIPEFTKTSTTYFVTVGGDVSKVTVNATAESSQTTVRIYGNTDLQEGENKVLISVTAKNGDVRTYRVYITKE